MFKKGDVVVCVDASYHPHPLVFGQHYTVKELYVDRVSLEDQGTEYSRYRNERFKLVEQPAPVAAPQYIVVERPAVVGDMVRRNPNDDHNRLRVLFGDGPREVKKAGPEFLRFEGIDGGWNRTRFEVLELVAPVEPKEEQAVFNRDAWVPQIGEKVYVTGKDRHHGGWAMDGFINDGKEYTVTEIDPYDEEGTFLLSNTFYYCSSSLTPVNAPKQAQETIAAPVEEEVAIPMAKGCKVVLIDPKGIETLQVKKEYTVTKRYADDTIALKGFVGRRYHARRFKVVEAAPEVVEIPDIRGVLFDATKNKLGESLCSYGVMLSDGDSILQTNDVCHARIRLEYGGDNKDVVALAYGYRHQMQRVGEGKAGSGIGMPGKGDADEEAHRAHSDYIINRSPWATAFITKDMNEAEEKDILMNVDLNIHQLMGACIALRSGMEQQGRSLMFKLLKDEGINEHVCWIMACGVGPGDKENYQLNGWGGAHDVMDKYRNMEQLLKFFKGGYFREPYLSTKPYRNLNACSYQVSEPIAEHDGDANIGSWLYKNIEKKVVGEGWNKSTVITKEAVIETAKKLEQLFKEAK